MGVARFACAKLCARLSYVSVIALLSVKDFLALLTAVVGGGALVAFARLIYDSFVERQKRKVAIRYLAMQLAFQFEAYVLQCARAVSSNQDANQYGTSVGQFLSDIAEPIPLPVSDSYCFLAGELLNRVFGFSQFCRMAQLAADFVDTYTGDREAYNGAIEEETVKVAVEALEIARSLRREYKLPERKLKSGKWDIDDFVRKEIGRVRELEIQRDEAMRKRNNRTGEA